MSKRQTQWCSVHSDCELAACIGIANLVAAQATQIAALEKDIIRLTGAWVAEEQKVAALEEELEWHRDADRQDYIRTGGRSSSKLLEEIAALEAEVKWLRQCRTCGGIPPSSGKVCICGGTNFVEEEIRHLRLELFAAQQDFAPFVALR